MQVYEKRPGVAVPGVMCCLGTAVAVTVAFYGVDAAAGLTIAPSTVWIAIASALIYSIWDQNGRTDIGLLYPTKGETRRVQDRLAAVAADRA
jgi:translocator protein